MARWAFREEGETGPGGGQTRPRLGQETIDAVDHQYEDADPAVTCGYCTTIVIFIELWPSPQ
jgi:hypothetical protein